MYRKAIAIAAVLLAAAPARAVNKCTGPDGAVVFQDAPCGVATKKAEVVRSSPAVTGNTREEWSFHRSVDAMTAGVSCAALSPVTYISDRSYRDLKKLRVLVMAQPGGKYLAAVRIESYSDGIFHNDISGMGLKTEPGAFHEISLKAGQKVAGFTDSAAVIDGMLLARSMRLRVRFWPYDNLLDSNAIGTAGLPQAVARAAACAKDL